MKDFRILILAMFLFIAPAIAGDNPPVARSIRLWLIIDTSSSNRSEWKELQVIAKAAVRALQPGDRIRVVATTSREPRLVVLEQITSGDVVRKEILRALSEVQPKDGRKLVSERRPFFGRLFGDNYRYRWETVSVQTDIKRALELPLSVVAPEQLEEKRQEIVLLLTCARWTDSQAREALSVEKRLSAAGFTLFITGTKDANRTVVLAAARNLVNWHELGFCDPATWVANARQSPQAAESKSTPETQPAAEGTLLVPLPKTEVHGTSVGEAPSTKEQADIQRSPAASAESREKSTESGASKPALGSRRKTRPHMPERSVLDIQPQFLQPAPRIESIEKTSGVPSTPSKTTRQSVPTQSAVTQTAEPPTVITLSAGESPIEIRIKPTSADIDTRPTADSTALEDTQSGSNGPLAESANTQETKAPPSAGDQRPNAQRGIIRTVLGYWYVWIGLALAVVVTALASRVNPARGGQDSTPDADASEAGNNPPLQFVARINGTERVLGPAAGLHRLHIGSGLSNALRIAHKDVEERHLELTRRRHWRIKNLSRKSVDVNGSVLHPGRRVRLDFPVLVGLTDKMSFHLFLRPAAAKAAAPSISHKNSSGRKSHGS